MNLYSVNQKVWYQGREATVKSFTLTEGIYYYLISETYWLNRYTKFTDQLTDGIPESQLLPVLSREQREGNEY